MSRLQYEMELAYLRGDFARIMCYYEKTQGNEAARLRASLPAVVAAISLGGTTLHISGLKQI
ncbi:MAG TPA: hypothetical protein GXZ96_04500 [Firmicutes bacterium]|jgi:hypothetical protein|nr:hypothetical protein [Bacillota bacterium]